MLQNYTSAAIQSKGVRLSASVPVALKATVAKVNDRQYRTTIHSFQMLPVPVLFKHYIIGKANVDIHLVALKKSKFSISYTANGKTSVMTGKLEPFDSYLLRDLPDTGIRRISSSKAIAAFLYNSYYTKQIPGRTTGHKFIIPSINYPKYFRPNAKMRISSLQDGTFIRTTLGSETVVMKLDRGKYIESDLKPMVLSSSQPIAVMLSASRYSTPTYITYLPDVSQFAQEYTLDISYPAYVTIITPTAFKKQLLFSESYIPEWVQTEHVVLDGAPYFIATTKLSGSGLHKISMADPIGRFGGFVAVIDGDFIRGLYPLGMPIGGC